jgi:hypothetical protein
VIKPLRLFRQSGWDAECNSRFDYFISSKLNHKRDSRQSCKSIKNSIVVLGCKGIASIRKESSKHLKSHKNIFSSEANKKMLIDIDFWAIKPISAAIFHSRLAVLIFVLRYLINFIFFCGRIKARMRKMVD